MQHADNKNTVFLTKNIKLLTAYKNEKKFRPRYMHIPDYRNT